MSGIMEFIRCARHGYHMDEPFEFNEGDREEMAGFDRAIDRIQRQKILRLRELAWRKGAAALKLENLKSESGEPFIKEEGYFCFQKAIAGNKTHCVEFAYLCSSMYDNAKICGWVKGKPTRKPYDDIGPMCGSAGVRYYCRICGNLLALEIIVNS